MKQNYKKGLESNIWKYGIYLITSRRLFWPIITVYFLTFPDTAIRQIGYFLAAGQVVGFILEVPSGYVSDKIGHKKTLVLSKLLLIFSTTFYLIGGNFWIFAVASALFSAAIAFQSGTISAFMQETLIELGRKDDYSQVLGKVRSVSLFITTALLAGVSALSGIDMRWPIAVSIGFDIVGFFGALTFVSPRKTDIEIQEVSHRNFRSVLQEAISLNFIPVLIFAALLQSILMGVGILRDVYQQFLGISVVYLGLLFALSRAVAALVSSVIYKLKHKFSIRQYYLLQIAVFTPLMFAIGFFQNKWLVAALFIITIGFLWGKTELGAHYKLEYIEKSKFKATLLSLGGLMKNLGFAGTGVLLGLLADKYLYSIGYMLYAFIALALLLVAYGYFLKSGDKPALSK